MKPQTKNILIWILTGIVLLLLMASGGIKIMGGDGALKLAAVISVAPNIYRLLGVIEITSAILFTIPRTAILGTLLLSSYFGGAIATLLQHHDNILFPVAIEALVWVVALIRFPELSCRLRTGKFDLSAKPA